MNPTDTIKFRVSTYLADQSQERLRTHIYQAIDLLESAVYTDGSHHKVWLINEALYALMGKDAYTLLSEPPDWDRGIAP